MPNLLQNVFTPDAVHSWSLFVREAWLERKNNPDAYLRSLPPPGQRLATGPWSPTEEEAFEARLNEFREHRWPLSYWGIFSLALPYRTGAQCRAFYRQSKFFIPGEEIASIPLASIRACLEHHKPTLATLWNSNIALQVETRVNAALQGAPLPQQQAPTPPFRQPSGAQPTRITPKQGQTAREPPHTSLPLHTPRNMPLQKDSRQVTAHTKPPLAQLATNSNRPFPPQVSKAQTMPHDGSASKRPLKRPAPLKSSNLPQSSAHVPGKIARKVPKITPAAGSDESEDEFVAGTLRKIKALPAPPPSKPSSSIGGVPSSSNSGAPGRFRAVGVKRHPLRRGAAVPADELGEAAAGLARLTIMRLDKAVKLPGWARHVQPYTPLLQSSTSPDKDTNSTKDTNYNPSNGQIVNTRSILSFNFAALGRGNFLGVIVNAPLSEDPNSGVTASQLACMSLPECLAADAIVCMWASKQNVGEAVGCMAKVWGCKYVENLTWVHLAPGGDVARAPAPFTRSSHSTLLMGRRGGGDLELRHQRNPDVIVQPALGGGRFPDVVREMLETLLPEGKLGGRGGGGDGNGKSGGERVPGVPRFLEVAFHGAEPGVRPGWVKLVESELSS